MLGREPKPIFHQSPKVLGVVLQERDKWLWGLGMRLIGFYRYLGPVSMIKTGYREWSWVGGVRCDPSRLLPVRRWHGDLGPGRKKKYNVAR